MRNPNVPESLNGWHILHRMFRFDRNRWELLSGMQRDDLARQSTQLLSQMHSAYDGDVALAHLIGHKADLMITHYARSFEQLALLETKVDRLGMAVFLRPVGSYLSVLELGMYDATAKFHSELAERGLEPQSEEWIAAFDEMVLEQAREPRNGVRLWAKIPVRRHVCFYPMNKRRGELYNWYAAPYEERARMMHEHGKVGRSYRGLVTQVISGSSGFDEYEWGVDLYADDPLVFKNLINEMRFDEASARYGEFGSFHNGLQFSVLEFPQFLKGDGLPRLFDEPAGTGAERGRLI
jgi:peroxiredoxin